MKDKFDALDALLMFLEVPLTILIFIYHTITTENTTKVVFLTFH